MNCRTGSQKKAVFPKPHRAILQGPLANEEGVKRQARSYFTSGLHTVTSVTVRCDRRCNLARDIWQGNLYGGDCLQNDRLQKRKIHLSSTQTRELSA